jgi:subfamily B ATP-binding cassette protein HlyB/CyaB
MDARGARPVAADAVLTDGFLWALGSLCRLHRVPFDPELVLKQFPPPYDLATLLRAAQACGLKAGLAGARADALESLPLPCLGFVRAAGQPANDPTPHTPALLVRADGERLLYLLAGENAPRTLARGEFAERFQQTVLLAAPPCHRPRTPTPPRSAPSASAGSFPSSRATAPSGATCCSPRLPSRSSASRRRFSPKW